MFQGLEIPANNAKGVNHVAPIQIASELTGGHAAILNAEAFDNAFLDARLRPDPDEAGPAAEGFAQSLENGDSGVDVATGTASGEDDDLQKYPRFSSVIL